jgi:hypothetical protein
MARRLAAILFRCRFGSDKGPLPKITQSLEPERERPLLGVLHVFPGSYRKARFRPRMTHRARPHSPKHPKQTFGPLQEAFMRLLARLTSKIWLALITVPTHSEGCSVKLQPVR